MSLFENVRAKTAENRAGMLFDRLLEQVRYSGELKAEIERLRAKNRQLNRRAQQAEKRAEMPLQARNDKALYVAEEEEDATLWF